MRFPRSFPRCFSNAPVAPVAQGAAMSTCSHKTRSSPGSHVRVCEVQMVNGGFHASKNASGDGFGRVAATAQSCGDTGNKPGTGIHSFHVARGGAHVLCSDVTDRQRRREPARLLKHPPPNSLGMAGIGHHHTLASTPPNPSQYLLSGHAACQANAVAHCGSPVSGTGCAWAYPRGIPSYFSHKCDNRF